MMLGAQARAAEYNAARNASARQASREAEEQKLPPKPTPISLSAYTRNTQVSRNKGAKNWVPLVLPEVDEDAEFYSETSSESKQQSGGSPQKNSTPSVLRSDDTGNIRVNMPEAVVPVAPRAMRMPVQPALPAHPSAATTHPQATMPDGQGFIPTDLYAGNPGNQTVDCQGHLIDGIPEGIRTYDRMMVPTDITPTKQELKLSMLSQAQPNPLHVDPDAHFHQYKHGALVNPMHLHQQYPNQPILVQYPVGDFSLLPPPHLAITGYHRPEPQHRYSDFDGEPRTAIYDPQPELVRRNSDPEPSAAPVTPFRPAILFQPMNPAPAIKGKENEEPYDRKSNVQKFMATQQAVAKTGKTVLHNPELRKNQESNTGTGKSEQARSTPCKARDTSKNDSPVANETQTRTAPKVPPGLEDVAQKISPAELLVGQAPDVLAQQSQDDRLREFFGVGTDDWFDLKPTTSQDRKKMQEIMSHVALGTEQKQRDTRISTKAPGHINKWLHTDPRGLQAARAKADEIATDYSVRFRDGDPRKEHQAVSRENDVPAGLIRGAGNVMATLTEYVAESQSKTEDTTQDYFNKTKPAPEFAVERGLGANLNNLSLFERVGNGVYNPPHRISRDPRFRTSGKERVKARSEDGWMGLYNPYDRRK